MLLLTHKLDFVISENFILCVSKHPERENFINVLFSRRFSFEVMKSQGFFRIDIKFFLSTGASAGIAEVVGVQRCSIRGRGA
jgi:hypothetical protein